MVSCATTRLAGAVPPPYPRSGQAGADGAAQQRGGRSSRQHGYDPCVAVHHRDGFEGWSPCCPHPAPWSGVIDPL